MDSNSGSESCSTGLVFQLLASLGSFLVAEGSGGTISGNAVLCVKLDFAAVDATDCAMEGTVNWARREEGRPALAGTAAAVATAGAATGEAGLAACVGAGTVLAALAFAAGAAGAAAALTLFFKSFLSTAGATDFAAGLAAAGTVGLATDLVAGLLTGFAAGLATGLATGLAGLFRTEFTDLAAAFGAGFWFLAVTAGFALGLVANALAAVTGVLAAVLAGGFVVALAPGLAGAFGLIFTVGLALDLGAAFTAGFPAGFMTGFFADWAPAPACAGWPLAFAGVLAGTLVLPALAFTSVLLAENAAHALVQRSYR